LYCCRFLFPFDINLQSSIFEKGHEKNWYILDLFFLRTVNQTTAIIHLIQNKYLDHKAQTNPYLNWPTSSLRLKGHCLCFFKKFFRSCLYVSYMDCCINCLQSDLFDPEDYLLEFKLKLFFLFQYHGYIVFST